MSKAYDAALKKYLAAYDAQEQACDQLNRLLERSFLASPGYDPVCGDLWFLGKDGGRPHMQPSQGKVEVYDTKVSAQEALDRFKVPADLRFKANPRVLSAKKWWT